MEMMGEKRLHARIVKSSIGDLHLLSSDVVKLHLLQIVAEREEISHGRV
jgi:hypothetical protein